MYDSLAEGFLAKVDMAYSYLDYKRQEQHIIDLTTELIKQIKINEILAQALARK